MEKFITEFEKEQQEKMALMKALDGGNLKKALESSLLLDNGIFHLKEFVTNYVFDDTEKEVQFFKVIKPHLCSHVIYYRKMYNYAFFIHQNPMLSLK